GPRAFGSISGEVVQVAAFSSLCISLPNYIGTYFRLLDGEEQDKRKNLLERKHCHQRWTQSDFATLPRNPLAYWITDGVKGSFKSPNSLGDIATPRQGLATSDNNRFLRCWHEVQFGKIGLKYSTRSDAVESGRKWFPYNKGGEFRKWYGNNLYVINWEDDGKEVIGYAAELYGSPTRTIKNQQFYFRACVTWNDITASSFSARLCPEGFIFDVKGSCGFPADELRLPVLALLCSKIVPVYMGFLNPTTTFQVGDMAVVPFPLESEHKKRLTTLAESAVTIAHDDWNSSETAWEFSQLRILRPEFIKDQLEESWELINQWLASRILEMANLETQVNNLLIGAYGLESQLDPNVSDDEVTLNRASREEDIKRLLSYAIGCVMGRYSLDKPGLIYAYSGSEGFDPAQYKTFRADDDGIIPLLESDWGIQDDAANRIVEFISVVWPKEHLDENLKFIADSLTPSNGEQPKDTIRRYLATGFYKHHLSMYKKRPIYWLFSSGKQRAFQCLVYLHRYNEGTLARMRTEYVIPLMGKMTARLEHLQGPPEQKGAGGEIEATKAVTVKRKLEKERENIKKQLAELQAFDEKLRHYADLRIKLDLDDGVKVNYGKFSDPQYGDILAEVKAICGTKDED
ncbi:MAG TPA: BREX-1 system adenine-specific DNA-methyltransferase PglX, partial [Pirellula sp.]|nr:BREX-1 system adenine-specific DNA-methyltransferase PglX [Pirellula sp.]